MHGVYELKDQIVEELERFGQRGEFSKNELPTIDMLAHTAKNLCKLIEMCEEKTGYSYGSGTSNRGGYSNANYSGEYSSANRMPRFNYSYRGQRRDSMGRYSSDNDWMIETLEELKESAPNETMRREFDEFITRMERTK